MPSPMLSEWTAHLHDLDPTQHPRLIAYIADRGRWPSWRQNYGDARPAERDGWAQRLHLAAGPGLRAVRLSMTPTTTRGLDDLPPDKVLGVLRRIVVDSDYAPGLGVITPEWSARAGWHWHGLLSAPDAQRLDAMPRHLGAVYVHPRPVVTHAQLRRAVAYQSKGVRRNAAPLEQAAHAERMLGILAATGRDRLPQLAVRFGV